MDFTKSVSFKSYGEKNYFFASLALSALRILRIHSDLLDGTAFEALPLVVCTKGSIYEKVWTLCSTPTHFKSAWQ